MKSVKLVNFFASGILAVLLLAGCFNPITVVPPKTGDPLTSPFTVDIMIGKDGQARSVAGPDADRIKRDIRNIIQLVVVNDAGQIMAFNEVRRKNPLETTAVVTIDSIPFGQTYYFLLLMGHWEREFSLDAEGNYVYKAGPPTLLAAGLKKQSITGSGKVTITMWPLVVDTKFTTANTGVPPGSRTAQPGVTSEKPGQVSLLPVDWKVTWTVKNGGSGDGFTDLVRAQKVVDPEAGDDLEVTDKRTILKAAGLSDSTSTNPTIEGNVITLTSTGDYTSAITRIGTEGSVAFNLKYVPFNLTDGTKWMPYNGDSEFDLEGKPPAWIIRNGVNDEAQNVATDFKNLGQTASANGNGAVSFVVEADGPDPDDLYDPANPPPTGTLVIKDGKLEQTGANPKIGFTTAGYSGTAGVYYAVAAAGADAPGYAAYTRSLGDLSTGIHTGKQITCSSGDYDVYVIVFKDGKVSAPIKINTAKGSQGIDYEWGKSGRFVAVAYNSDKAVWSNDGGRTWTTAAMPNLANWRAVTYGNGVFIAVSCTVDYNVIARSEDGGVTWTAVSLPGLPKRGCWVDITYGNGVFLAISNEYGNKVARSEDSGITWQEASLPAPAEEWEGVGYGGGVFIVGGCNTDKAARSEDGGKTWTKVSMPNSANWGRVIYGNNMFVAICDNYDTDAAWSIDGGITWNPATLPFSDGWRNVAYGDDVFLAVCDNAAARSVDYGKTWTAVSLPSLNSYETIWWGASYGDDVFVVMTTNTFEEADDTKVALSVDGGITWTDISLPVSARWFDLAFGQL